MSSQVLVPGGGCRGPTIAMKVEPDAAAFAVFESELAPGAPGPAPHRHLVDDEAFYVLAGSVAFLLDGEVTTCGPGSCVLVPRGVAHGFGNPSAEPARVLVVTTPAPRGWSRACTRCGAGCGARGDRRSLPPPRHRARRDAVREPAVTEVSASPATGADRLRRVVSADGTEIVLERVTDGDHDLLLVPGAGPGVPGGRPWPPAWRVGGRAGSSTGGARATPATPRPTHSSGSTRTWPLR